MSEKDYLKDISEIKNIMNRSTRFLSLSGLSGILAGIYALIGAYLARQILEKTYSDNHNYIHRLNTIKIDLLIIAFVVAFLSIATGYVLTRQKTKKQGVKIWDSTTKRLLFNFLVPLVTGGIFALILLYQGFYGFVAPATLIFYGLALFSASKYTIGTIKYLGIAEIILGLAAMNYIGLGLYFWVIGFGVFHIIYGTMMYLKEKTKDKNSTFKIQH
jgi:hypothetical protein